MSLVAWYPLNGNTNDYSGNNNIATTTGISYSAGKIGNAISFNNSTSRVNLNQSILQNNINTFSISMWAKITPDSDYMYLLHRGATGSVGDSNICILLLPSNTLSFAINGQYTNGNSGYLVDSSKWFHIIMVYSNNIVKGYVNGNLIHEYTQSLTYSLTSNYFSLGNASADDNATRFLNGLLNDVRIYDHALSEKEIKEIAKAKILHYTFDDFQEPTTNVVTNANSWTAGWSLGYNTGILYDDIAPPAGVNAPVLSFYDADTNQNAYVYCYGDYAPQEPNTTYTVSMYIRTNDNNFRIKFYTADNVEVGRYNSEYITVPNDGEWHRIVWNSFINSADSQSDSLSFNYSFGNVQGETQRTWFCAPQMEAKDHVTPYVYGTRGATVNDQSGFRNNATLALATTPQWVSDSKIGSGTYKFNGTQNITTSQLFYDNINQCHTVSAWVYPTNPSAIGNQQLINFNLGYRFYHNAGGQSLMYNNSGVNDHYVYGSTIPANQWRLVTWVYDKQNLICKVYYNGLLNATSSNINETDLPSGFLSSTIFGSNFYGYIDDVRVYATALSDTDILELYQTRASIDNAGNIYSPQFVEDIEPTINLISKSADPFFNSSSGWTLLNDSNYLSSIISDSNSIYGGNILKIVDNDGEIVNNEWGGIACPIVYGLAPGKTYTFKIRFKVNNWTTGSIAMWSHWKDSTFVNSFLPNDFILSSSKFNNGWNEQVFITTCPTGYDGRSFVLGMNKTNLGCEFYVDAVQFEDKSYDTPFSNNSRFQSESLPSTFVYKEAIQENGIVQADSFSEVGITDGLIGYWPFNRNANDYSGNNYNGVLSLYGGAALPTFSDGINFINSSASIGNYVLTSLKPNTTSNTLSTWIKWGGPSGGGGHHFATYGDNNYNPQITTANGSLMLFISGWTISSAANVVIQNTWQHVVFTTNYNGSTTDCKIYINNNLVANGIYYGVLGTNLTNPLAIGQDWDGSTPTDSFNGSMKNFRFYNRALSAEEIAILYETTSPTSSSAKITKDTIYMRNEIKEVY